MAPRDTLDVSIGIFMSFKDLGIAPALVATLEDQGITSPFPIQTATIPDAIKGRDVLGRGQTGSGKTLAFGLSMLTRLEGRTAKPHRPLALVLSPTRELAVQISDVIGPLSRKVGLSTQVVAGGLSYVGQIKALRSGVTILVATPGRLIDLIEKKHVQLDDVMITVLDEADQMADMGFLPVVKDILGQTKDDGQRLLFSATLDRDVDSLVKRFLKDPITHSLENEKSRSADMLHHVLIMDQGHKDLVATQIAAREGRTIFFVRTKHGADKLAEKMLKSGVPVGVLHGGKSQGQRTRVLASFKDGRASALVATDVAARGIHVDDVSLVVHVDAPADHKDYLHRAGRTARAGATGVVVTLATHKQKRGIFGITNRAGVKLSEVYVRPSDPELVRVTGSQEPSGIPVIVPAEKPGRNDRGSRDRGDRGGFRRGHASNFKSAVKVVDVAVMMFNLNKQSARHATIVHLELNEVKNQFVLSAVSHRQSQSTMTGQRVQLVQNGQRVLLAQSVQHATIAQFAQIVQREIPAQIVQSVPIAQFVQNLALGQNAPFAPIVIQRQNDLKNQIVQQR